MADVTQLRFYEFFAGAGLARLGLTSWQCLWANDIDPRKVEVYENNFGRNECVLGDVADIEPDSLPCYAEMAWASFPCQDLSLAGWRRGMSAERSGTFWAFWRIMRCLAEQGRRPPLIVIENVVGLLHGDNFTGLCEALAALGMQFGAVVINARYFLPQSRPRVFVIAVDRSIDVRNFVLNKPDMSSPWLTASLVKAYKGLPQELSALWCWWNIPIPKQTPAPLSSVIDPSIPWDPPSETKQLLDLMSPAMLSKVHKAAKSSRFAVGTLYKRTRQGTQRAEVRFDGIAGCLRTPQGGSSRQTILAVDNGIVKSRLLAPREAARLMGAPDSFWLPDRYNDAYRAMGDAVCVPVVEWLDEHLLNPLGKIAATRGQEEFKWVVNAMKADSLIEHLRKSEFRATLWEATMK